MAASTPAEEKKPRKKKERAISEAEFVELFLGTELLRDLPESALNDLARGKAELREVAPGEELLRLAPARDGKTPLLILVSGSLRLNALVGDGPGTPLNVVLADEVFFDKAYDPEGALGLQIVALQPAKVVQIGYDDANLLLKAHPNFKDHFTEILQRCTDRKRDLFDDQEIRPIAEFLAKEGLAGIQRLKIKRLDKCIDCDACFEACAERRGVSRLGDYQSKFDRIGLPYNCHSCSAPACIAACKFGHISLVSGELKIADDCAGCTMCKKACPYSAINMIPLESIPDGFLDRSPNARGKQVAMKCDDCIDYQDQACISACPTGSLFQVTSKSFQDYLAVFALRSTRAIEKLGASVIEVEKAPWIGWRFLFIGGLILATLLSAYESIGRMYLQQTRADTVVAALIEAGLDEEKADEIVNIAGPDSDYRGPDVYAALHYTLKPLTDHDVDEDLARKVQSAIKKRKTPPWEDNWRVKYFSLSAVLYHTGLRAIPPPGRQTMKPGNQLSLLLGYLGALAMLLSQLYRVRRAMGARMGNMRTWLEFHIYTGYLGAMLIFFHATYEFRGMVFWLCFVPMVIAILTGVLGRYVYFLIPRSESGRAMDATEIRDRILQLNAQLEELIKSCKGGAKGLEEVRKQALLAPPVEEAAEKAWYKTLLLSFVAGFRQRAAAKKLLNQLTTLAKADG